MEKIVHSEEELDDERNVLSLKLLLTGRSEVGEGDFHVDVVTSLILEMRVNQHIAREAVQSGEKERSLPRPRDSFPLR